MFQFRTNDDEQPEGLAAALLGTKPNSMPAFGLAATLSQPPNPSYVSLSGGGPAQDAGGQAGSNAPDTGTPEAAPADDAGAGEWGKMLAQLYEAGKFKTGYLSKIFGSINYANLAEGDLNTSMKVGLNDIRNFENTDGMHVDPQGSVIDWRLVDWSKYGADPERQLPPETVMRNFLSSAMN